jgi:hypothetical protein
MEGAVDRPSATSYEDIYETNKAIDKPAVRELISFPEGDIGLAIFPRKLATVNPTVPV